MQDTFARLREELEAVDRWLKIFLTLHLSEKERELALTLQRYVTHCFHEEKKWRSGSCRGTC